MSFLLPALFGAGQGAVGIFGAQGQNKSVAEAAGRTLERIQDQIQDRYRSLFRQQTQYSRETATQRSKLGVVFGHGVAGTREPGVGFEGGSGETSVATGESIRALYRQIGADIAEESRQIKLSAMADVKTLQQQKEEVKRQAESGMSSPLLAGIGGAAQGVQQGMSMQAGLDQMGAASAAKEHAQNMAGFSEKLGGMNVDEAMAQLKFAQQDEAFSLQMFSDLNMPAGGLFSFMQAGAFASLGGF